MPENRSGDGMSGMGDAFTLGVTETKLSDISSAKADGMREILIDSHEDRRPAASTDNPTLVIGLGGTGIKSVDSLKGTMKANSLSGRVRDGVAFLGFDCNQQDVSACRNLQPQIEVFAVTLENPKAFREKNPAFSRWVLQKSFPPNAIFGAGQSRQVSRMCFMHHMGTITGAMRSAITPILGSAPPGKRVNLDVYIVSSLCGGAGAGMYTDMVVLVRDLARELNADITVFGVLVGGDVYQRFPEIKIKEHPRMLANTYACVKEIQYLQDLGSEHIAAAGPPLSFEYPLGMDLELSQPLFDLVLLVQSTNRYGKPTIISGHQLQDFLSSVLYLMADTPLAVDHRAKWVNPNFGYSDIFKTVDNAPRCFSSVGYVRIMYPETEFINFMSGYYGELILTYLLDAVRLDVPEDQRHDPARISIADHIARIAEEHVDTYRYEVEDLQVLFNQELRNFSFAADGIENGVAQITEKAGWEEIPDRLEEYEKVLQGQLDDRAVEIENAGKKVLQRFHRFLDDLPYELLKAGIGVRHLLGYLESLTRELDQEEVLASGETASVEKSREQDLREWRDKKGGIKALVDDKPFYRPRKKLSALLPGYSLELSEYLNDRLRESMLQGIIQTYRDMDDSINTRLKNVRKIVTKFDKAKEMYAEHKRSYQKVLAEIADKKKAYHNHMEFSVITTRQLDELCRKFLDANSPRQVMMLLFGPSDETGARRFWDYREPRIEAGHIIEYIQSVTGDKMDAFRMPLSKVVAELGIKNEDISNEVEELIKNCSAQWTLAGFKAGLHPNSDCTVALPEDVTLPRQQANTRSTSDRVIEVLLIDYAMPAPLLTNMPNWRRHYDNEQATSPDSLHIFPQAYSWPEGDDFPGEDEMINLFALGLAFGHIHEMGGEEKQVLAKRYKKKDCRGFVFKSGTSYFLMPFYPLPAQMADMTSNLVKLGQGRVKAFQEFSKHPEYGEVVRRWIEDRIVGRDINQVVELLTEYMNAVLAGEKAAEAGSQLRRELEQIRRYVEEVKLSKSLAV